MQISLSCYYYYGKNDGPNKFSMAFLFLMLYISDSPTAVTNYGIYKLCDKNVKHSKEFVRVLISNH